MHRSDQDADASRGVLLAEQARACSVRRVYQLARDGSARGLSAMDAERMNQHGMNSRYVYEDVASELAGWMPHPKRAAK